MSNSMFYKNIKEQNINLEFFYEPQINLCGKYIASQLKLVISGLSTDYKNLDNPNEKYFFLDAEDLASEKKISSDAADIKLKEAEDFFIKNKDLNKLKENLEIFYLLNQVDLFLDNPSNTINY